MADRGHGSFLLWVSGWAIRPIRASQVFQTLSAARLGEAFSAVKRGAAGRVKAPHDFITGAFHDSAA
jgi:hypothetical protein